MRAVLVANGSAQPAPTANALLDQLLGAEVVYVAGRDDRAPKILEVAARVRAAGGRPFSIPIGASTPLGALAFALAVAELVDQMPPPDVIIHSSSSGGTQAGLVAGCRLLGLPTRVIGVSADETADALHAQVRAIVSGIADIRRQDADALRKAPQSRWTIAFVGGGYGVTTEGSREAIELCARAEALFLDPTYTSKAMAALIRMSASRNSWKARRCSSGTPAGRWRCFADDRSGPE